MNQETSFYPVIKSLIENGCSWRIYQGGGIFPLFDVVTDLGRVSLDDINKECRINGWKIPLREQEISDLLVCAASVYKKRMERMNMSRNDLFKALAEKAAEISRLNGNP